MWSLKYSSLDFGSRSFSSSGVGIEARIICEDESGSPQKSGVMAEEKGRERGILFPGFGWAAKMSSRHIPVPLDNS